jgi:hypothetical protein
MILAYGAEIGAGMLIVLLLSVSSLLQAMLAGGLAHAFVSNPPGFVKRLSAGTGLVAILCVLPILLAIYINPKLFTASNSRMIAFMILTPAIPVGCVIGVFVSILKLRR